MRPEGARREMLRLEDRRLEIAPAVMGGDPSPVEEDRGLERRITELARSERGARSDELKKAWRRNHPGGGA